MLKIDFNLDFEDFCRHETHKNFHHNYFYFKNVLQIQQALRPLTWIQNQKITVSTSQSEINQTNALLRWTGSFLYPRTKPTCTITQLSHPEWTSSRRQPGILFLRTKKKHYSSPPKTLINFRNLRRLKRGCQVENTFSTNSPLDQQQVSFRKPYLIFVSWTMKSIFFLHG